MLPIELSTQSFSAYPPQAQKMAIRNLDTLRTIPLPLLAAILHEIITGQMPVKEKPADARMPAHFRAPSSLIKGLDPRWDEAILSCLQQSPALRPSDARVSLSPLARNSERSILRADNAVLTTLTS